VNHKEVNNQLWYKVKWVRYEKTTWEPKENLKNIMKKIKEYCKKIGQAIKRRKN